MAQLAVAIAVNIAIAVALNALFPPPDIENEGPRLTDLGFTGASYGKFVPITFGTDRVDGTIIDTQDPAIEEVVSEESQGGGFKGGGPDVTTTSYTYFLTCRILFGIEGADELVRLWADGKLIYDRLDQRGGGAGDGGFAALVTSAFSKQSDTLASTFYPGGKDQDIDPEEEGRRGSDIPAYGHLVSIKIDRMPLANFGNRIPNFTAEISYSATASSGFQNIDRVPAGFTRPDADWQFFDRERDLVIGMTDSQGYTMRGSTMEFDTLQNMTGAGADPGYTDGFLFSSTALNNSSPLKVYDVETGTLLVQLGVTSIGTSDSIAAEQFGSIGSWHGLKCILQTMGLIKHVVVHGNGLAGTEANGSYIDLDKLLNDGGATFAEVVKTNFGQPLSGDIWPANNPLGQGSGNPGGLWIPDPDRRNEFSSLPAFGIMWWFGIDETTQEMVLIKLEPNFRLVIDPVTAQIGVNSKEPRITAQRRFPYGSPGDDFASAGEPSGWALNRTNGELILCNGNTMVLYNPTDDVVLATKASGQLSGRNNYYTGNTMGMASGNLGGGTATFFDTNTLETINTLDLNDVDWTPDTSSISEDPCVWDDRAQALYISRGGSGTEAIVKLFLNRVSTSDVGLDFVNLKLMTRYQRYEMGGLQDADVDVTDLAGESLPGYTINRDSTVKGSFQPLRNRFMYDIYQSDWGIKAELRGKSAVLTIPEEFVGELKRGRDITSEPPLTEARQDDLELPMRINVRYKNQDIDYDIDVEHDKRWVDQNPTMSSLDEQTIDIPIVNTPENMKRVAQQWLWTIWNERVSYKTVIPWTYITLDPSDVFNMGAFGETLVLRLNEMDIGLSYALGISAAQEDVKSYSSTIAGGTALGFTPQFIGGSLPSRLFFLDSPLLDVLDMQIASVSAGYVAFGAFEDGWPGATVFRSSDNTSWAARASANQEAATAKVVALPSTWGFSDDSGVVLGVQLGDFRNRIQEVVEGGTMDINPMRREDVWTSVTEEAMLDGANTFAVITSSGVEVIQYIDATVNDDGSITLERLLRGRLGTEDIADADTMALNDEIVLLTDSTGTKQVGGISKQNILTTNLNQFFFYKGVTVGTVLEDAATLSFSYTGRDIKPYSVANLEAIDDDVDTFNISWARRCRGPLAAEWEDGTGEVPLNEALEQYTLEVVDASDNVGFTITLDDVTTFALDYSDAFFTAPPTFVRVRQESAFSGFPSPNVIMAKAQLTEPGHIIVVESAENFHNLLLGGATAPVLGNSVDDVLVVCINGSNENAEVTGPITSDPTFPFVQIDTERDDLRGSIDAGRHASMFYRVMTDTEPADGIYDFTWITDAYIYVDFVLLRSVDLTKLPAATGFEDGGIPSSTTVIASDFTTTVNNSISIFNVASRPTSFPSTIPTGFSWTHARVETAPSNILDDFFSGFGITEFPLTGPTGTQTWIWATTSNNLKAFNYAIFEPIT